MSDLSKQLRKHAEDPLITNYMSEETLVSAADEIERLNKDVDGLMELLRREKARVEALREALALSDRMLREYEAEQSSEFSRFIREAEPEEKERVYRKVIDEANEEQEKMI